ncbi:hypothetical protein [Asaia lannensis]|uniref:hypothetical protein n=1 Tax=Asaia lannensis TaxID=415421 RepID=UPI003872BEC5
MSEILDATIDTPNDVDEGRFAGMQFGSDTEVKEDAPDVAVEETPEAGTAEEKPEPKPDTTPEYIKRRIGKSVALQRQAERERDEYRERVENLEKALRVSRGDEEAPREQTPDEIRAEERQRIQQAGAQQQKVEEFKHTCQTLAQSLATSFGADSVVPATTRLMEGVGLDLENAGHQSVIQDIAKLPNAAQVYHALSNDPDAAYRIFEAEDRREGYAELRDFARGLAKQEEKPAAQARPASQAPRPPARVPANTRTSSRTVYDDDVSMDDFVAMRSKSR